MEVPRDGADWDALIIGCGMAGLGAGIRLALHGRRVLIIEKHNAPGGLNSFYFLGGRKFDVGLHAVTNYAGPQARGVPLLKICRQLRIPREAFQLAPQLGSRIAFPGVDLRFGNGIGLLEEEVARAFPREIDGFRRLRQEVLDYDAFDLAATPQSARAAIRRHLRDPLLEDMLLCPLMYYGSAREQDMDLAQFAILWRAIFEEGFGRPLDGVRVIIRALLDKYRELGGERRMRCGVRRILVRDGRACGVELDNGELLQARHIISTAGQAETRLLCGAGRDDPQVRAAVGRLSFAETISVLARQPAALGARDTIVFFNSGERFAYAQAEQAVDLRSGVICFPNNYAYPDGATLPEGLLRVTVLARHAWWTSLPEERYQKEKGAWFPRILEAALRFMPGMDPRTVAAHTVFTDMFTPRTVEKFTAHLGGAVYGSPDKARTGETQWASLYLAGTDQGFLGITGALLSGISMANRHILQGAE